MGDLLFGKKFSESAYGKYRKNNVIRVNSIADRSESVSDAFRRAMVKAAKMADAKGFPRIGMTKQTCGTQTLNGARLSHTCRILFQMVEDGEEAKPEGKRSVIYYSVASILRGQILPEDREKATAFMEEIIEAQTPKKQDSLVSHPRQIKIDEDGNLVDEKGDPVALPDPR
ncbi:MAG: hypothetical protein AAF067_02090 [Pseudomonadota bacterium]